MLKKSDDESSGVDISFDALFNALPFVFYKSSEGVYLGGNMNQAKTFGFDRPSEFIGKTIFQILDDQNAAQIIDDFDKQVMQAGLTSSIEESISLPEGSKAFLSQKQPIFGPDGNVIGLLGFSMDISDLKTRQKKTEHELEYTKQRAQQAELAHYKQLAEQQLKFQKTARQVAHDIRSPLSALMIMLKFSSDIPEEQRVMLRNAATRIEDIASNLFAAFPKTEAPAQVTQESRDPILVSSALLEILAEKKVQHAASKVRLDQNFTQAGCFAWIQVQPSAFKRMISNLINNAIESLNDRTAPTVSVELNADTARVEIIIEDNGHGMSSDLVQKIKSRVSISEGKVDGQGIGLMQVRDTLDANDGQWIIESAVGVGSRIMVVFPRVPAQLWIADALHVFDNDTIVVLDDDNSIHHAWDIRFKELINEYPSLKIIHHHQGDETIALFNGLDDQAKHRIYLLTDYELLKQAHNGLEVIEAVAAPRSTLVTSHFASTEIQQEALRVGTKILPKSLAADVRVYVARGT